MKEKKVPRNATYKLKKKCNVAGSLCKDAGVESEGKNIFEEVKAQIKHEKIGTKADG